MSFIIVHGRVENVMRCRLNIKTATANKIWWILKTMFDFAFMQMTKVSTQSSNKFDSCMIFTIKNIIGGWTDVKFEWKVMKFKT